MTGPETIITPPVAAAPLHSLLASARPVTENDNRWENGLVWQPDLCGVNGGVWDPCPVDEQGDPTAVVSKSEPGAGADLVYYQPFVVEMSTRCKVLPGSEVEARARRQFDLYHPTLIELEFWSGSLRPDNFALQRAVEATQALPSDWVPLDSVNGILNPSVSGSDTSTVTPVDDGVALDLIAAGLGRCGAGVRGMIHAPAPIVERWARKGWLGTDGPKLVTRGRGDVVVAYSAVTGDGPLDVAEARRLGTTSAMWVYATLPAEVRLGEIQVLPEVTRSTNDLNVLVERTVAVTVDPCCAMAVRVEGPTTAEDE